MIISASRRTDIPAFYAAWLMGRLRAGYCVVSNPFNPAQQSRVGLTPQAVDVIVFWTRHPRHLMKYLDEIDRLGYRYYFQYTLMDNPRILDPHTPDVSEALRTFEELSARIGPERMIWRYDPIVFSSETDASFHREVYRRLAAALRGCTLRSVISIMDHYPKIQSRLKSLAEQGLILHNAEKVIEQVADLIPDLVEIAHANGMDIQSCAEELGLESYGVRAGKCIDDAYIAKVFGIQVNPQKDPNQRKACGCVVSKDIGAYDSCAFGCVYCYATQNFERAWRRTQRHTPDEERLI